MLSRAPARDPANNVVMQYGIVTVNEVVLYCTCKGFDFAPGCDVRLRGTTKMLMPRLGGARVIARAVPVDSYACVARY